MTGVSTSAGVLGAVAAVVVTGEHIPDPLITVGAAADIVWTGVQWLRRVERLGYTVSLQPPGADPPHAA